MGAQMGKGAGNAGVYDPIKKNKEGYWKKVQSDLNKQVQKTRKGNQKIGR